VQQTVSEDVAAIWTRVRDELESSVPATAYKLWIEPLRAVTATGSTLYLAAPPGIRAWVERRYSSRIAAALRDSAPALRQVGFVVDADPGAATDEVALSSQGFGDFVIGGSNRFAHAAALAVAEIPGEAYNPLFLHGPPGVGKTHLLAAITEYLRSRHPGMSIRLTTAEGFTSDFVSAIRGGRAQSFKAGYRELDVLLIDDVQFLEDKSQTGEEFFHTFNALHERGRQIVLSSDRPPRELARLAERLRDRFEWGLCAPIDSPDLTTRVAVLRRLARPLDPSLADPDQAAVLGEIAASCSNLRQLEGALTRVVAFSSVMDASPTPALVRDLLRGSGEASLPKTPEGEANVTLEAIQDAVCEVFHISRLELLSKSRTPRLVRARQLAIHVARERLSLSLHDLAEGFGRDRATVVYSLKVVQSDLAPGSATQAALEAVLETLAPAPHRGEDPRGTSKAFPTGPPAIPPDAKSIMSRTSGGPR
jgi:chromosomal replication initiator protein